MRAAKKIPAWFARRSFHPDLRQAKFSSIPIAWLASHTWRPAGSDCRRAGIDRGCAKTRREIPCSSAEREFSRSFSLCEAIGLEIWRCLWPSQSFRTAWTRSGSLRSAWRTVCEAKAEVPRQVFPLRRSPVRANRGRTGLSGHTIASATQSRAFVCPYIVVSSSRSGLRNVDDGIHDKLVSARS